jgi:hypothetical protein
VDAPHDKPARLTARRNPDGTFHDVCDRLVWHGRTRLVNDVLEARLRALDGCVWHFERDFSICSVSIPFMVFGPVGVFLLQASRGYWSARDIVDMHRAAGTLRAALKSYPDPVRTAIVMLDEDLSPRQHFAGRARPTTDRVGEGPCWILGDGLLSEWLHSFRDHGLSEADVAFLRAWGSPGRAREPRRLFVPANEAGRLS